MKKKEKKIRERYISALIGTMNKVLRVLLTSERDKEAQPFKKHISVGEWMIPLVCRGIKIYKYIYKCAREIAREACVGRAAVRRTDVELIGKLQRGIT